MASSDDEEVVVPQSVTNYHLVDTDGVPVSFSTLPIVIHDDDKIEAPSCQISVRGTMDGGLQSVFKDVIAWKLRLDGDVPEVSLLSKNKKWIKLEKPKKSYEECIRTTLVTIHLLYFSKKNPEASLKSFWEYSRLTLSSFDDKPSLDEFKDHLLVIKLFIDSDEALAKSQVLQAFVKNPGKVFVGDFQSNLEEKPFIIDDLEEGVGIDEGEESEEESDLFDSVCSICDNGGELLCCEGRCLRSFHATKRAGADSDCASLGLTRIQVEAMQNFLCKNCQLKQHQCFVCGKLGSSDKSANAEVFSCVSATCGRFYHPKCVAELLFLENKIEATELGKRIAAGESFTCSVHRCIVCKQVENKEIHELQFAICRRCPKSYHRKCLPRKITFEDNEDEDIVQRAWDGLLPNRILIYCLKHEIDEELGTPYRDHIKFPEIPEKKRDMDAQRVKLKKIIPSDRMAGDPKFSNIAKRLEKLPKSDSDDGMITGGKTFTKKVLEPQNKWKILKKNEQSSVKQLESKESIKSGLTKVVRSSHDSEKALPNKAEASNYAFSVPGKLINSVPKILPEIRKDVLALVEETSSSLSQNDIRKMLSKPSTYSTSVGQIDKSITLGKIEGAIEAVRTALEKLEGGGNVEDAKAVCEPEILKRLIKWNVKLKVYLAPVLHGARYSSYGRHFTKFDKLQEIVDKLQWYVQDGDMIVDFCCGANEFSILMNEKLDSVGRKCSFKNFDILQAKNDFNFEMRDWMTVRTNELPTGSKLIMGLNPPFGLNARLANQFIDKALTFRPKLLILIVPEETRRLDTKQPQYDLIWEDKASLSGKSFYLPGSIDVNDKQIEQWNVKPPVLYLWSRPDWTSKHKGVASMQGHTSRLLPSFSVHKDSKVNILEDTSVINDNSEEKYEENDATHGEKEGLLIKQKGLPVRHDHISSEPDSPAEVQFEAEKRTFNLSQEKRSREKFEKKEPVPAQKESGREVYIKKLGEKKSDMLDAGKKITEQNKKRKLSELHEEATHKIKNMEDKNRGQLQQDEDNSQEHLPDMSISPPDRRRESVDLLRPSLGSFDWENSRSGYMGSGAEMGIISPVRRPSGIHDDPDTISKRYNAAERDSFYIKSPHGHSETDVFRRDYSALNADEKFRGYNNGETFGINSYGRSSDTEQRTQLRNYSVHGDVAPSYKRPTEIDTRSQSRAYGIPDEEDHPVGSRFSLGSSGSSLGHPSLYPSSTYRHSSPLGETASLPRYPPRLDEEYRQISPGLSFSSRGVHGIRRDTPPDSFGFAPGKSFSKHGAYGGWVDD